MKPAHCYAGDMLTGFIIVEALQHSDEVDKLLEREEQWIDLLINTHDISTVYEDHEAERSFITFLSTHKEVTTKNTLDEIIQKIRRATAINFYTQ
jgi:LPS O-antigen subunit length determinant protein (WzzB/FepE family)